MASFSITGSKVLSKNRLLAEILGISSFIALTILGSKIEIPTQPVPFTLQTMIVVLSGALLGKKNGAISQFAYLLIGAAGLPVFAGPIAGVGKLLGPTGGYLLAFPFAAFVTGWLLENRSGLIRIILSVLTGIFIIYALGILHLNIFYLNDINKSLSLGLGIFSIWEIAKIVLGVGIIKRFRK